MTSPHAATVASLDARLATFFLRGVMCVQLWRAAVHTPGSHTWWAAVATAAALLLADGLLRRWPHRRVGAMAVGATIGTGVMLAQLLHASPPIPHRPLEATALLVMGWLVLAFVIAAMRRRSGSFTGAALTLAPLAFALVVAEWRFERRRDVANAPQGPRWEGDIQSDSLLGERYAPGSELRLYYPDDPRGYFEQNDPRTGQWKVDLHAGSRASLRFLQDGTRRLRMQVDTATGEPWHVQLHQVPLVVRAASRYKVRFRVRADAPRRFAASLSQGHDPWEGLGYYKEFDADTTWRTIVDTLVPTGSDRTARFGFSIGAAQPSVEVADFELRDLASGAVVEPHVAREWFVRYRINALGCRGAEVDTTHPHRSWRVLAIGDSYTLGVGVHEEDTFARQLEGALSTGRVGHPPIEVINCGISGASTLEERRNFERLAGTVEPNVVLLTVVSNDNTSWREDVAAGRYYQRGPLEHVLLSWALARARWTEWRHPAPDFTRVRSEIPRLWKEVKARNARLVVMVFQTNRNVMWDSTIAAVRDGVRGTDIPVLYTGSEILPLPPESAQSHAIDPHPSHVAHRIAARLLADLFRRERLDAPPPR